MDPEDLPLVMPTCSNEEELPTLVDLSPPIPPPDAYPEEVWEEKTLVDPVIDLI